MKFKDRYSINISYFLKVWRPRIAKFILKVTPKIKNKKDKVQIFVANCQYV